MAERHASEMPHAAMGAVAICAVVMAGLILVYVSREFHPQPLAVLAVLLCAPVLILLMVMFARRRRTIR